MRLAMLALLALAAEARIYVYAQRDTPGRRWMSVMCDGEPVAKLRGGAFFAIEAEPGKHTLGVEDGVPVTVDVRGGEDVFVRLNWSFHVARNPIPVLAAMPRERAASEMRFLVYVDRRRILSKSVPPADPRPITPAELKRR